MVNYYEILQVSRSATKEDIKKAFRERIKQWHPDINPDKQKSNEMTVLIKDAYDILKDDIKRKEYDRQLDYQYDEKVEESYKSESWQPAHYHCAKCGRQDETIRYSIFTYVISLLIITYKGGKEGIYCWKCRTLLSLSYNIEVLFLGWWGFPFGILYSLQALWNNSKGGISIKDYNAHLLGNIAFECFYKGDYEKAYTVFKACNKLQPSQAISEIVQNIELYYQTAINRKKSTFPRIHPAFINVLLIIIVLISGTYFYSNTGTSQYSTYSHNDGKSFESEQEMGRYWSRIESLSPPIKKYANSMDEVNSIDIESKGIGAYISALSSKKFILDRAQAAIDSIRMESSSVIVKRLSESDSKVYYKFCDFVNALSKEIQLVRKLSSSLIVWQASDYPEYVYNNKIMPLSDSLDYYSKLRYRYALELNDSL